VYKISWLSGGKFVRLFSKKVEVTPKILGIVVYKTIFSRFKEVIDSDDLKSLEFNENILLVDSFILNYSILKCILLKKYDDLLVEKINCYVFDYFYQDLNSYYNEDELEQITSYCNKNKNKYIDNIKTIFEFQIESNAFNNPIRELSKIFLKETSNFDMGEIEIMFMTIIITAWIKFSFFVNNEYKMILDEKKIIKIEEKAGIR
jgi:hypothetical protein